LAVQADVTRQGEAERLIGSAVEAFGAVDILVNNAGVYPLDALLEMAEQAWDLVVDTNLRSVHLMTQAAGRRMVAQGRGGAVVNVASIEAWNQRCITAITTPARSGRSCTRVPPHGRWALRHRSTPSRPV
jgi:NAD(P)-dependent dehydrogenase (short-subunit alcohol dehydrogenase family)